MTLAARIDAATPATRERSIDGLRALAIFGVVCGHWLVGAFVLRSSGALDVDSPLRTLDALAPASWLLQMLGLFFLVGGYSAVTRSTPSPPASSRDPLATRSLTRARERGQPDGAWLRQRFVRLGWPVLAAVGIVAAAVPLAALAGTPAGTLRTWAVLFLQPLWFIGIYAVITALTPVALALDRRFGVRAALPLVAAVAVVDALRYGAGLGPAWLGYLTVIPAWMFTYQLGVAWSRGRLGRRAATWLLAGGAALFAALLAWGNYPLSMVSVPGAGRSNSNPPSLLVPALAAAQTGAALLLRGRLERLLRRRPRLWAGVALLNTHAMTIFCWHQTALFGVTVVVTGAFGVVPGLTSPPHNPTWVVERLAWFPVLGLVLAMLTVLVRRFETPRR